MGFGDPNKVQFKQHPGPDNDREPLLSLSLKGQGEDVVTETQGNKLYA